MARWTIKKKEIQSRMKSDISPALFFLLYKFDWGKRGRPFHLDFTNFSEACVTGKRFVFIQADLCRDK